MSTILVSLLKPRNASILSKVQKAAYGALYSPGVRWRSTLPINTVILFVPQQEAWIAERMGKYHKIMQPGINFLIPILDKVKYVQSLKEIAIDIPKQSAITSDNVILSIDGVLYLKINDPYKASYGVEDPEFAITQLAQTTMRSELGKINLDSVFRERESLNIAIIEVLNKASASWGISCLRYEIRDIRLPQRIQEAMEVLLEAERRKRAKILESEGKRESEINVAEGQKRARILISEADKTEQINKAYGEAAGILAKAEARAKSISVLSTALAEQNGNDAAALNVAEMYVRAFGNLAKSSNTVILPADAGNVGSMVTQAMTIYQNLAKSSAAPLSSDTEELFSEDESWTGTTPKIPGSTKNPVNVSTWTPDKPLES